MFRKNLRENSMDKLAQFHAFPYPANFRTEKRVLPRKREKQI